MQARLASARLLMQQHHNYTTNSDVHNLPAQQGQQIEDLMVMEAIRLSLLDTSVALRDEP